MRGQRRGACATGVRVRIRVHVGAPADDVAARVERRVERRGHLRAMRCAVKLVGAAPLHHDRARDRLRQARGFERRIARAVTAVAAAHRGGTNVHAIRGEAGDRGHAVAQRERRLRRAVDDRVVRLDVGEPDARSDRGAREVRRGIARRRAARRARERRGDAGVAAHRDVDARGRDRRWRVPHGRERVDRAQRLIDALGDHAGKIAIDHDRDDAGLRERALASDRAQLRAVDRGVEHAAVQHVRKPDIAHEPRAAGDARDCVRARRQIGRVGRRRERGRGERDILRNLAGDWRAVDELCKRRGRGRPAVGHGTIGDRELARRRAEPLGRAREQHVARERRRAAQLGAVDLDRHAAERAHVPRHDVGVTEDHVHARGGDAELLGDDPRIARAQALAELHLARECGDATVGLDAQARLDARHRDTRLTARIARTYTPQRHRCGASAARIRLRWATARARAARPTRGACRSCSTRTGTRSPRRTRVVRDAARRRARAPRP